MANASAWKSACTVEELRAKGSLSVTLEKAKLALFWHEEKPWALSNVCNHKGGPLAEGRKRDEYVVCPWHAWEYSVKTGKGPPGYDEERVATYTALVRGADVWVNLEP